MKTIRIKRSSRVAASLLMLLAATAPASTPAIAQTMDLQSAAMAEAIDDSAQASEAVVQPAFAADAGEQQRGDDFYCGERRLGQWFYCERPKAKPSTPQAPAQPQQSSTAQLKAITRQLDELKARAILEPTEANVIAYVRYQREQLDRASTFSDTWQRALWQNPDIDYTLQRPVSTVGKRAGRPRSNWRGFILLPTSGRSWIGFRPGVMFSSIPTRPCRQGRARRHCGPLVPSVPRSMPF